MSDKKPTYKLPKNVFRNLVALASVDDEYRQEQLQYIREGLDYVRKNDLALFNQIRAIVETLELKEKHE